MSRQTLDQQQALVNQLKASAQGDQATIAAAQVQLSYTQIQSPVSGRVGIRAVDAGNFLRVSDAQGLFSVTQIDPIAVEFSLPQQQLPLLHELLMAEQPARVKAFIGNADNSAITTRQHKYTRISRAEKLDKPQDQKFVELAKLGINDDRYIDINGDQNPLIPGKEYAYQVQYCDDYDFCEASPQVIGKAN